MTKMSERDIHEKQNTRSRAWNAAHRELTRERSKAWYWAHRDKALAHDRGRRRKNPEAGRIRGRLWHATKPEHASVRSHHNAIFGLRDSGYRGMPFAAVWNPRRGGSYAAGAQWVIENLGHRPGKNYQLHIVDRSLGFVPNNLQWVPRDRHKQVEMIAQILLENQNLKKELGRTT